MLHNYEYKLSTLGGLLNQKRHFVCDSIYIICKYIFPDFSLVLCGGAATTTYTTTIYLDS